MDVKIYAQAVSIQKLMRDNEGVRNTALEYFDSLARGTSSVTDTEYWNMLASMRSTIDKYFDKAAEPLSAQFEAL